MPVLTLPDVTLPVALTAPPVLTLPPVTLPVADISPVVRKLLAVTLLEKLAAPEMLPTTERLATCTLPEKLPVVAERLAMVTAAYELMEIVVLVTSLVVNTETKLLALSSHTQAMLLLVPRLPMKPMSSVGLPVCSLANRIKGSSTTRFTVSIVVVLPCTVRLPVMVRSLP